MTQAAYPVHVRADLEPGLSRWLWLVKWIAVIPHLVVLAFLWVAFAVLSVVAFVAILFTGRYPRAIFDFNVGVLRWSWRVAYYSYGALGTDRYPPFTLAERPDYPAHLDVDYPERLSRGLVLVKWWLLALPHYLVVGLLIGTGVYVISLPGGDGRIEVWGLIGILVTVAGVVLLFTGRYPTPLFDFVLGLNRWVLRVAGYAALMTDEYPPFRLDQGGAEPDRLQMSVATDRPGTDVKEGTGPQAVARRRSSVGGTVAVVAGSLLVALSLLMLLLGVAAVVADREARDDGFLMSDPVSLSTETYALASESIDLPTTGDFLPGDLLGRARLTATSAAPLFIGVARSDDAESYLAGIHHDTVSELGAHTDHHTSGSGEPHSTPAHDHLWFASAVGTGTVTLDWKPPAGDWTVVVMNADGSSGIAAEVAVGAQVPWLDEAALFLLAGGAVVLIVGGVLITVGIRARADRTTPQERTTS